MGPREPAQVIRPSSKFLHILLQETLSLNTLRTQRAVWRGSVLSRDLLLPSCRRIALPNPTLPAFTVQDISR